MKLIVLDRLIALKDNPTQEKVLRVSSLFLVNTVPVKSKLTPCEIRFLSHEMRFLYREMRQRSHKKQFSYQETRLSHKRLEKLSVSIIIIA